MPTALLLSMRSLSEWSQKAATVSMPGGSLPYGLQCLQPAFGLKWSDSQLDGIWRSRPARMLGGTVKRATPGLQGSLGACYAMLQQRPADVALSVFENVGLGFARWQRFTGSSRYAMPHVMLTCWLAESCQHMSALQLRSIRRSIPSISKLAVFSANQIPILREYFSLETERISAVPFGVDTGYYDPTTVSGVAGGGGVVAVGGDSRRDYATLAEAVRIADVPLTLACYARNVADIALPSKTRLLSGIPHHEYRRLLLSADLVVTPTVAPAYPSGQSVVLEAMSMGRATLTTDSPAIREYVTDGVDGMLVPPREPSHMAQLMKEALADSERRQALGKAAAQTVREHFSLTNLWGSISDVLSLACETAA
jgi:hypothetical protein